VIEVCLGSPLPLPSALWWVKLKGGGTFPNPKCSAWFGYRIILGPILKESPTPYPPITSCNQCWVLALAPKNHSWFWFTQFDISRIKMGITIRRTRGSPIKWKTRPTLGCKVQPLLASYTCKDCPLKSNYELSQVCATYWMYSLSQLDTSIFPTNKVCCLFGVENLKQTRPLTPRSSKFFYTWGFHDSNIFFPHPAPPFVSQNSQSMAILAKILRDTWQSETLSIKTTESPPPPPSPLPPYLYCKRT
jgi:hypothetical protein